MKRTALCIGLLITAVFLVGGCAEDRQSSNPAQPQASPIAGLQLLSRPAADGLHAVPLGAIVLSETKTIKANNGGDVSVGLVKVKFLPHTIEQDTDVTITLVDQEQMRFRIEPADLVLLQPVRIEIEHMERTDHLERRSLRVVRMVDGVPQALSTQQEGGKHRADVSDLGDFALADMDDQGGIQFIRYLSGPGYLTKLIEADKGGEVHYDRYQVTIPKGALPEDTYITVRDPGSGYLMCELEPHMVFLAPVELELDLHGLDYQPFTDWTVFWFDPDTEEWENQGGSFAHEKLTVQLDHFSRYAAGRAGW